MNYPNWNWSSSGLDSALSHLTVVECLTQQLMKRSRCHSQALFTPKRSAQDGVRISGSSAPGPANTAHARN